ncbi:MAG: TIGR00725 family protein [Chloroflexota bacterium]|nr:TIGR00725 family protein [Chloroflexota bacterium]
METGAPVTPQPLHDARGRRMIITVIGANSPSPRGAELAREVGRELAERGCAVACGGLGGVMEAVCQGAKSAGGTTIGILPGADPAEANAYVDLPILTDMGYARNVIVVKTGRAVIAVDGAYGTLSEIGHALADGIPVVGLETWELPEREELRARVAYAASPAEAVDMALAAAHERDRREQAARG